jgi:hypothetical protein
VAIVEGKTTTAITEEKIADTRWSLDETSVAAIPGAPAPPWWLLVAFAAIMIARGERLTHMTA